MSNKLINNKFRAKCFEAYGLNSYRNFLEAPRCECGCGAKGHLIVEDRKQLFSFMDDVLSDNDCNHCAVFAHAYDDTMYAVIKTGDVEGCDPHDAENYPIKFFAIEETDMTFFKEWDAELCLHCYGLMIQDADGSWDIIEK